MRISDWSSDVCSSDLLRVADAARKLVDEAQNLLRRDAARRLCNVARRREGRRGLVDGHERGRCHMHRIRWNTRLVDPLIEADLLCGGGVVLEQIGAQI